MGKRFEVFVRCYFWYRERERQDTPTVIREGEGERERAGGDRIDRAHRFVAAGSDRRREVSVWRNLAERRIFLE